MTNRYLFIAVAMIAIMELTAPSQILKIGLELLKLVVAITVMVAAFQVAALLPKRRKARLKQQA